MKGVSGLLHRAAPSDRFAPGYTPLISRAAGDSEYLDFGLVRLGEGERHAARTEGDEVALVVLSGSCRVEAGGRGWSRVGSRPDVFAGRPYACYVPPGSSFEVVGCGEGVEMAVCAAPGTGRDRRSRMVIPEEVDVEVRGAGAWRRTVHEVIGTNVDAGRLLVGETFTPPGMWASYPPHKHDEERAPEESPLEEIRHFRMDPQQGFGLQLAYGADAPGRGSDAGVDRGERAGWEDARVVRSGNTVRIAIGYHTTAAAPGYRMYALWAMAGRSRRYGARTSPVHAWLRQAEPMLKQAEQ